MFEVLKTPSVRWLLVLALFLRILIMPFYFHPDIKTYNFQASFLQKGVVNIYIYLDDNKQSLPLKEEFVYFPLTYFFLGGYQIITSSVLGPNFNSWLSNASALASSQLGVFKYLFILKFPYLVFDILIGLLLTQFFINIEDKKKVFIYWLFNPIWIILIYVYSNVDVFPVFLSMASILLLTKNKYISSGILLGLSAGFKAYPLMFLPIMLLFTKGAKQKFSLFLTSMIVFLIIVLPFYSQAFKDSALVSGLTTRIFLSGISLGFGQSLLITIISFSALFFYLLRGNQKNQKENLYKSLLIMLVILFSTIHFHIQWLLWMAPFLSLILVEIKTIKGMVVFFLINAVLIPLLYQDQFMTSSLLNVVNPFFSLFPTPFDVLQKVYDPYMFQSIAQSVLLGGSLILIWDLIAKKET